MTSGQAQISRCNTNFVVCLFFLYMVATISVCRHPLDQQNTRVLQLLPGLEMLTKSIMGERQAGVWWLPSCQALSGLIAILSQPQQPVHWLQVQWLSRS